MLPPLKRPISATGPALEVAREPEEQRGLVDLQRRDAVVQLVRREEEREVLEAANGVGPLLDVAEAHGRRVAQHRGVDEVLADVGPPELADELFHARGHGGERYCKARTYAHACRSPVGRQSASTTAYASSPASGGGIGADEQLGQPERERPDTAADRRRDREPARDSPERAQANEQGREGERRRHRERGRDAGEAERAAPGPRDEHLREQRGAGDRRQPARAAAHEHERVGHRHGHRGDHPRREVDDEAAELRPGAAAVARAEDAADDLLADEREHAGGRRDERERQP